MSFLDDDDELYVSSSNQDALVSQNKAKKMARIAKAQQKGELLELQKQILRNQIDPKISEENVQKTEDSTESSTTFGTKTLKETEQAEVLQADTEQSTEDLVRNSSQATLESKQQEQEVSNEDA